LPEENTIFRDLFDVYFAGNLYEVYYEDLRYQVLALHATYALYNL